MARPAPDQNMAKRKALALRINEDILAAVQRWANDDLRSLNAQIEFLLRAALRDARRLKRPGAQSDDERD